MHEMGHQSDSSLLRLIKQYFYFANMIARINAVVGACEICQQTKKAKRKEPLGLRPTPTKPFEEVSLDHKNLPNGWFCLVILDILSRFPNLAFVKSTSFEANKEALEQFFSVFHSSSTVFSTLVTKISFSTSSVSFSFLLSFSFSTFLLKK